MQAFTVIMFWMIEWLYTEELKVRMERGKYVTVILYPSTYNIYELDIKPHLTQSIGNVTNTNYLYI